MSINLNESGEQSTGGAPIPPNSRVFVKLIIQHPKAGREARTYPLTQSAGSSLEYLATQLEVCCGTFAGKTLYHNFNLSGASTDGQRKAVDISMRSMRALVEAARMVSPKDNSPQATQARMLNAWTDVDGLTFPIVVDCEISRPNNEGKRFVNNVLKRVVTVDDAEYQQLRTVGQIITDEPLPQVSAAAAGASAAAGKGTPMPPWAGQASPAGQQTATQPPAQQAYTPPPASASAPPPPAWAQPGTQTPQAAMPPAHAFPSEAGHIDQLPF